MTVERSEVETFFAGYANALAERDAKKVAGFWGVPALVLSDAGGTAVSERGEVEAFFASAVGQYGEVASTEATVVAMERWSDRVVDLSINWEHRDGDGRPVGTEQGHYVLRKGDDGRLRIQVYTPKVFHGAAAA